MRLGIIGFGYMGTHLTRKLLGANHECVVLNSSPIAMDALAETEALITFSLEEFIQQLPSPRIVWMTIPEALLDQLLTDIAPYLYVGDILVNGSNSYYMDDIMRAKKLEEKGVCYLDCCVSGGQLGLLHGYRLLIGGDRNIVERLSDVFNALVRSELTTGDEPVVSYHSVNSNHPGYLYCGPNGAGHFVQMIRNAIEYGLMGSYAEGMKDLKRANPRYREEPSNRGQGATYHSLGLNTIARIWARGSRQLDLMITMLLKESERQILNPPLHDNPSLHDNLTLSPTPFTLKKSRTDRGLKRNWSNQPYSSNYGQHAAYREVADFTDKIISMMCFEYSDYDKLQSNHHVLQRLMKHGYQKVHTDYQSVLNQ